MALRKELQQQGNWLFRYRSYLPIAILLVGMALYVTGKLSFTDQGEEARRWYELGCTAVALLGLAIRVFTIGYASDNTSGRNTSEGQVADTVNTTGIYNHCRHPLYLGNFFMWLGIAAFTQNLWFLVAFIFMYWVYYERIMYAEEEYLIEKFGDDYLYYAARVPAFWPRLVAWKKPRERFRWKKVIRQEKAGILNLFVIIMLMRLAEEYYDGGLQNFELYWAYAAGAALVWYIVIKLLQKTTKLVSD